MPNIVTMEFIAETILTNQKMLEEILRRVRSIEEKVEENSVLNKEIDDLFDEKISEELEDDGTHVEEIKSSRFNLDN